MTAPALFPDDPRRIAPHYVRAARRHLPTARYNLAHPTRKAQP